MRGFLLLKMVKQCNEAQFKTFRLFGEVFLSELEETGYQQLHAHPVWVFHFTGKHLNSTYQDLTPALSRQINQMRELGQVSSYSFLIIRGFGLCSLQLNVSLLYDLHFMNHDYLYTLQDVSLKRQQWVLLSTGSGQEWKQLLNRDALYVIFFLWGSKSCAPCNLPSLWTTLRNQNHGQGQH